MSGAFLVLDDGRIFEGTAWGATGKSFGEAVFQTGMTGYQETLTDPSYHKQVVVMTAPHIGNTGVNSLDNESEKIWVAGRTQLRRTGRRLQWAIWRRHGGRFLWAGTEEFRLPGRVCVPQRDRDRSRQYRPGRRGKKCRCRQTLHPVHAVGGRPGIVARQENQPPAGTAFDVRQSTRRLPESVHRHHQGQGEFRFGTIGIPLLRGVVDVRPDHHFPSQGTGRRHQGN